ncbi:hypothetical protein PJP10_14725 [Mycobacterium kansasii]
MAPNGGWVPSWRPIEIPGLLTTSSPVIPRLPEDPGHGEGSDRQHRSPSHCCCRKSSPRRATGLVPKVLGSAAMWIRGVAGSNRAAPGDASAPRSMPRGDDLNPCPLGTSVPSDRRRVGQNWISTSVQRRLGLLPSPT